MAFAGMGDKKRTWELLNIINPVNHGRSPEEVASYKVEPYVIAADVYAQPLHKGRGGWTWYTGSAGWMYQLITEWFIGIRRKSNTLSFHPCIPADWPSLKIDYRYKDTMYHIVYEQKAGKGATQLLLNGIEQHEGFITLKDDAAEYDVKLVFFEELVVTAADEIMV